jgi:prevent-host-death family protein
MNKIIGVTDLQRKFRKVFEEVAQRKVPYILTRGSRPEVVMVPYDQFVRYAQVDEAGVLQRFDIMLEHLAHANAHFPESEVEADLQNATRAVRKRR